MTRALRSTLVALLASLALAGTAEAAGGNYVFQGGSPEAQESVRAALAASRFDFGRVPAQITIRISRCGCAGARPGLIVLDEDVILERSLGERYAWGLIQHEYAHQVDFFLFSRDDREKLRRVLGGTDWCYEQAGLGHDDHGCERFAEVFTWAFWPSRSNIQREQAREIAPNMGPRRFRVLVNDLLAS